jgi:hypothetical protein
VHVLASLLIAAAVASTQAYVQGRGFYPGLSAIGYLGWALITLIVAWGSAAIIQSGRHEAFAFGFVLGSVVLLFLLTGASWRLGFHQELDRRLNAQELRDWAAFVADKTVDIQDEPIELPTELLPAPVQGLWRRPPSRVEVLKLFLGQDTAVIDIRWQSGLFTHGLLIGPPEDIKRYDELGSSPIAPDIHYYRWLE